MSPKSSHFEPPKSADSKEPYQSLDPSAEPLSPIFARKVIVLFKNGHREDYTHLTELRVYNPIPRRTIKEPLLVINGETDDVDGTRCNAINAIPIKDIHMTIIDWYIPPE